jgi:hypothetical protein
MRNKPSTAKELDGAGLPERSQGEFFRNLSPLVRNQRKKPKAYKTRVNTVVLSLLSLLSQGIRDMGYLSTAKDVLASIRGSNALFVSTPCEIAKEVKEVPSGDPRATDWSTLAEARWGPGIVDPNPGIIIEIPVLPNPEAELASAILAAGFVPITSGSRTVPAWTNDEGLTITTAEVRSSIDYHRSITAGSPKNNVA